MINLITWSTKIYHIGRSLKICGTMLCHRLYKAVCRIQATIFVYTIHSVIMQHSWYSMLIYPWPNIKGLLCFIYILNVYEFFTSTVSTKHAKICTTILLVMLVTLVWPFSQNCSHWCHMVSQYFPLYDQQINSLGINMQTNLNYP